MMDKIAMVLAGGGAKGAYEVGCWLEMQKMTKELGFKIDAFSGTSVGALNSALFACNSPEEIDKIWSKVTKEKIFSDKFNKILNVINDCFDDIDETKVFYLLIPLIAKITHGFDPKGLSQIIDDAKVENRIERYRTKILATYIHKGVETIYKKVSMSNCKDVLLASSSMPFFCEPKEVNGELCYDGGTPLIGNNLPIKPLLNVNNELNRTYKKIIVFHLGDNDKKYLNDLNLEGCKIYHIFPNTNLGKLFNGTLNFSQDYIQEKKKQAILDMRKEHAFLKEIKELFENNRDEEIHLYKGERYTNINDLYKEVRKNSKVQREANISWQSEIEIFNKVNVIITEYLNELELIDIDQFRKDVEQYRGISIQLEKAKSEEELNSILISSYKTLSIELPWQGDFDMFMSNRNNHLVFE